jgi:hypothetical protein
MKLTYNGTDERVFPAIGVTVKPGDDFDAPEGFSHPDCVPAGSGFKAAPTPTIKQSAPADQKAGE